MSIPGQASGDFNESSSALRILYVGHRNTFAAQLTLDGFTQTNPPTVLTAPERSTTLPTVAKAGVLSGSVAFTRPDAGNGFIGGPAQAAPAAGVCRPLGLFINDAAGNPFENTPAAASGQAPYVSSQGTMGTRLYETQNQNGGAALTWAVGDYIYASVNGYLTNVANADNAFEMSVAGGAQAAPLALGVVKIVPDSTHPELLFDLRI